MMQDPRTHLSLAAQRSTELRGRAAEFSRAKEAGRALTARPVLRTRLGWSLVHLGLRLATTPRGVVAAPQI